MSTTNPDEAMMLAALDAMVAEATKYGHTRAGRIVMPPAKVTRAMHHTANIGSVNNESSEMRGRAFHLSLA